ncbi:MAG: hypothetical protein WCC67_13005 [Candidatus Acidiferrales bacterium]
MSSMRIFSLITVVLLLGPLSYEKNAGIAIPKAVCVAISASGMSAAVTLTAKNLDLEITDASGRSNPLSASLEAERDDCRAVFDSSGNLLAVAVRQSFDAKQGLKIFIADTRTSRWSANFSVEPQTGLSGPLWLAGFLENSESLIVKGSGEKVGAATTSVGTILLDSSGKTLDTKPFERQIAGNPQNQHDQFADSRNNRLWYLSYPQFCPIKSTTLTGEESPGPEIDKSPGKADPCDLPNVIAFPDRRTVIMASTRADHDAVWRIDLGAGTGEEISAPRGRFPKGDQIDGNGSLSPDGQVFAFSRHQFSYGHFDNFNYKGSDIVVVQVRPLRLLGVIDPKGNLYQHGFAVDHRDGNTTVLVFSEGTWKRLTVAASKPDGHSAAMDPKTGNLHMQIPVLANTTLTQ